MDYRGGKSIRSVKFPGKVVIKDQRVRRVARWPASRIRSRLVTPGKRAEYLINGEEGAGGGWAEKVLSDIECLGSW